MSAQVLAREITPFALGGGEANRLASPASSDPQGLHQERAKLTCVNDSARRGGVALRPLAKHFTEGLPRGD